MDKKKDKLLMSAILAGALSAIVAVTCYLAKKWEEVSILAESMAPHPLPKHYYRTNLHVREM